MSIWLLIWLLLSSALIYFMAWTMYVLFKQKKAWKGFAARNNMRYRENKLLSPPEITGNYGDYSVHLFTGEHISRDMRGSRKLTALEIQLSTKLPVPGGVASGGMVDVIQGMTLKDELQPDHSGWDKAWIARSSNRNVLKEYFNPQRLEAITSLMKMKNTWIILVFREDFTLLRMDTPDPLDSDKKILHILKKMTETARILELKAGEDSRLKTVESTRPVKQAKLEAGGVKDADGLQLEEDPDQ